MLLCKRLCLHRMTILVASILPIKNRETNANLLLFVPNIVPWEGNTKIANLLLYPLTTATQQPELAEQKPDRTRERETCLIFAPNFLFRLSREHSTKSLSLSLLNPAYGVGVGQDGTVKTLPLPSQLWTSYLLRRGKC